MLRETGDWTRETGLWLAGWEPRRGPSAPAAAKPGSGSPARPPQPCEVGAHREGDPGEAGDLKYKVSGIPGSRAVLPDRGPSLRAGSGQPAAGPPHSPAAVCGAVQSRGPPRAVSPRRRAPRAPRDEAPPPAARLAAAAGSAGPHWSRGGAWTGAPGLRNPRRVGGGEGPRAPYVTRLGARLANPDGLAGQPRAEGPPSRRETSAGKGLSSSKGGGEARFKAPEALFRVSTSSSEMEGTVQTCTARQGLAIRNLPCLLGEWKALHRKGPVPAVHVMGWINPLFPNDGRSPAPLKLFRQTAFIQIFVECIAG